MACLLIVLGHVSGWWQKLLPTAASQQLTITGSGPQIRIEWDLAQKPFKGARRAELEIHDGDMRFVQTLTADELAGRNYAFYNRHTNLVEIELTLWDGNGKRHTVEGISDHRPGNRLGRWFQYQALRLQRQ